MAVAAEPALRDAGLQPRRELGIRKFRGGLGGRGGFRVGLGYRI